MGKNGNVLEIALTIKKRFIYQIYSKMTINWGTIQALENDFYTKVSHIKRLTHIIINNNIILIDRGRTRIK